MSNDLQNFLYLIWRCVFFFFYFFDEQKKGDYTIEREIGLTRGTIASWRSKKAKPSLDALIKLSEHFGVSIDELLGRKPLTPPNAPNDIAEMWNKLDPLLQAEVKGFMQGLLEKQGPKLDYEIIKNKK